MLREGERQRWGGDLRRRSIFAALAERTGARVADRWSNASLIGAVRGPRWRAPLLRRPFRLFMPRPRLAASEQLPVKMVDDARRLTDPAVVAIYDDAEAQLSALGIALDPDRLDELRRRRDLNLSLFRWLVVPTRSFAELVGLDPARVIVGGNGTDPRHIRPGPWPDCPSLGVVSGASPGRGIETLVEAARRLRSQVPDLRLLLWLVATSRESEAYLAGVRSSVEADPWIELAAAPYEQLGSELARATVLCIAHPANAYMDVALPVKLFDSMSAGRPLLVTPRRETAALVERHGAGLVTAGDEPDEIASAALRLLGDEDLARRLGAAGRDAAERVFDWRIRSEMIADEVLARERGLRAG